MRIILLGGAALALQACSTVPRTDRTAARPACASAIPRWTADSITLAHTDGAARGSVSDYMTGETLEHVTLYWERSTLITRSSDAGRFRLPVGDSAGVRTLHVRRIGYIPHRVAVRLVAEGEGPGLGAVSELSIRLVPELPPRCSAQF